MCKTPEMEAIERLMNRRDELKKENAKLQADNIKLRQSLDYVLKQLNSINASLKEERTKNE